MSLNEEGHSIHMRKSKIESFTSKEIIRWSKKHLDANCPFITDGFKPFSNMCDIVDLHHSINTKGLYKGPENRIFHWVITMINTMKRSIHGTYHSISPNHLPRYLGEFSFRFNNRFDKGSMIDIFLKHAVVTKPLPRHKLKLAEE